MNFESKVLFINLNRAFRNIQFAHLILCVLPLFGLRRIGLPEYSNSPRIRTWVLRTC